MNYVGFMDWVDGINDAMMMAGRELLVGFGWFLQVRLLLIHEENSFFFKNSYVFELNSMNGIIEFISFLFIHNTVA